jgi:hypothetical protein
MAENEFVHMHVWNKGGVDPVAEIDFQLNDWYIYLLPEIPDKTDHFQFVAKDPVNGNHLELRISAGMVEKLVQILREERK